ncbi:hypothetical protein pEaSNUABM56_00140 [Erwinia phage pEa_SNUABM_56]|uniref:Putative HNH endonuclease n=1 Tax=Erwinia phage pEp_SNUABM_01 TaxID=2601643 RepID=A0A5J6DAM3_9CAUD|nr:HNH endonuclease [Erwinia phage pEp_SNUABM_01]QEQ94929.1 putative HNH endonuclease [Erwinia phage pEp_SNUABM_01]UYL85175.1 hypothetical protein pEaSNUABM56_00140 [Erwinia phage pEa_SNUABM_56]
MASKICTCCNEEKDLSLFNKNSKKKDGLQGWCRDCCKTANNAKYATDINHRLRIKENNQKEVQKCKDLLREFKSKGCSLCPEKEFVALDLHHLDGETKDANVSDLMRRGSKKLIAEMEKCVVLCANCHRKVHAGILSLGL